MFLIIYDNFAAVAAQVCFGAEKAENRAKRDVAFSCGEGESGRVLCPVDRRSAVEDAGFHLFSAIGTIHKELLSAKTKNTSASERDKGANLCGTTLFAAEAATQVLRYNGRFRAGLLGKMPLGRLLQGDIHPALSPLFHQSERLSVQSFPDYSSLSTQFSILQKHIIWNLKICQPFSKQKGDLPKDKSPA